MQQFRREKIIKINEKLVHTSLRITADLCNRNQLYYSRKLKHLSFPVSTMLSSNETIFIWRQNVHFATRFLRASHQVIKNCSFFIFPLLNNYKYFSLFIKAEVSMWYII